MANTLKWASGPILFGLLLWTGPFEGLTSQGQAALAILGWMVAWWILEVLPLGVTALLPILLLPLFGILSPAQVTAAYGADVIFLFLGGFLLSAAIEKTRLQLWFARQILRVASSRADLLVLGFMFATGFLSLWISNTAAAMIMLPMARAVCGDPGEVRGKDSAFAQALLLGIAYAASIGGVGTIIGSPPNAILVAFLKTRLGIEIGFAQWMMFGLPLFLMGTLGSWFLLSKVFFRVGKAMSQEAFQRLDRSGARSRAGLEFSQKMVLVVFVLMSGLWIVRGFLAIPGLNDTSVAILGGILLYLVPREPRRGSPRVLELADLNRVPWDVLLLFGGGLAVSEGFQKAGVGEWIAGQFAGAQGLPPVFFVLLLVSVTILVTELASNTAVTAIFVPLMAPLAPAFGIEPRVLLMAVTMAASLSFMMPMATPPNAVVYGLGYVKMGTMIRAGAWLNLFFAILITALCWFWLPKAWSI